MESEVVGYQDEMAQRYIANALARAGARKERESSEAEESEDGASYGYGSSSVTETSMEPVPSNKNSRVWESPLLPLPSWPLCRRNIDASESV